MVPKWQSTYDHFHVDGIEEIAEICLLTFSSATFEYDLTCPAPPAQVQDVDQTKELLIKLVKVVH